jgi:SsrA-binding protein
MPETRLVATNPKARHDYFIEETYEVGLVLKGTEVKALREKRANLRDSFARIERGEAFLHHCHISPYSHGSISNHEPLRVRKLLLKQEEIKRLIGKTQLRGYSLVPLKIYFKRGLAKIQLGLARGKKPADKRETIKKRIAEREVERAFRTQSTFIKR